MPNLLVCDRHLDGPVHTNTLERLMEHKPHRKILKRLGVQLPKTVFATAEEKRDSSSSSSSSSDDTSVDDSSEEVIKAISCVGKNKDGTRCGNKTTDPSKQCHAHKASKDKKQDKKETKKASPCKGKNKKGDKCGNTTKDKSGLCHIHR